MVTPYENAHIPEWWMSYHVLITIHNPVPAITPDALPEPANALPTGTVGRHIQRTTDLEQLEEVPFEFPELAAESSAEATRLVREGLPAGRFEALRTFLDISTDELSEIVGITSSTLSRRRKAVSSIRMNQSGFSALGESPSGPLM